MKRKLSEVIKELEDNDLIQDYYIHFNWGNGNRELNIEFKNSGSDEILEKSEIKERNQCAFWE